MYVIRSPSAIRFYKPTFDVSFNSFNDNKHWLMTLWILEQAADASFYKLMLPKQLNDLGVGSIDLQSSLYSAHTFEVKGSLIIFHSDLSVIQAPTLGYST